MRNNILEIRLTALSSFSGALPDIMRHLSYFDLIYRDSKVKEFDGVVNITLVCRATSDINEDELIQFLEGMEVVNEVLSVFQSKVLTNESISRVLEPVTNFKLHANDEITHDVLHFAEARLSESYGPVACLLLRSAAKKSNNVGSLFMSLAENLNDEQKKRFLENIQGLDKI